MVLIRPLSKKKNILPCEEDLDFCPLGVFSSKLHKYTTDNKSSYRLRERFHVSLVEEVHTQKDMRTPARKRAKRWSCIMATLGRDAILHSEFSNGFTRQL